MLQYRLRTLLIVLALGPPFFAMPVTVFVLHHKAEVMREANKIKQESLRLEVLSGDRLYRPTAPPQTGEN